MNARELLEQYAKSDPDHVVLNFTHGAYSPKAFDALREVLDECEIFAGRSSDVDDLIGYIDLAISTALAGDL